MEVGILLLFVSTVLAGCSVLAFVWTIRQDAHDHADRLALAPLAGDESPLSPVPGASEPSPRSRVA